MGEPVWKLSEESGIPITVTQADDPAYRLLQDDFTSTPVTHQTGCYICEDPEFAQMGLPLCRKCPACVQHLELHGEPTDPNRPEGHIPADDGVCTVCGFDEMAAWEEEQAEKQAREGSA